MDSKSNPTPEQPTSFNLSQSANYAYHLFENQLTNVCRDVLEVASKEQLSVPQHLLQHFQGRVDLGFFYFSQPLKEMYRWLFTSREVTNFTYDITDMNKDYLASLVSIVSKVSVQQARAYMDELNSNESLKHHISNLQRTSNQRDVADDQVYFGRRLGWYAFVRATKPKVVVETGVDKGLGSCVLAAALQKNTAEGSPGRFYGIDIDPNAGYLFAGEYAQYGEILYGDAIETIAKFDKKIDLYVNDSDHTADYETREYRAVKEKLADNCVILGDNSHVTNSLFQFTQESGRQFVFFPEKPKDHWYPGAGIGIAFK